ncbi:MAG: amidohydrolase [Verrucomicrobiae bacterium]|nr:amidohydrolase [Verrucomicrobiae bacterium]
MRKVLAGVTVLWLAVGINAQTPRSVRDAVRTRVNAEYPALFELYKHFHANPELSFQEEKTAARLAEELRRSGYEVTTGVGGHGVVTVLKNGDGPTVLVRCDLDALPVKEQTGLPYASKVVAKDDSGREVPVMHACGHDVHMACLVGVARVLQDLRAHWRGTLVLIGQPAEERGGGARRMIADGLFTRFPKPDYCLALHNNSSLLAGAIGYTEGYAMANVDSVDITVRGVGGHGAYPHAVKDPIVLAAQIVLALQTIVSREIAPGEPAVVTVGSIHGGSKHNIIPDEVQLQLTLRSYTEEVRQQTIAAIHRITRGLALAAGLPEDRLPIVKLGDDFTPATFNDPDLTLRLAGVFKSWFGREMVVRRKPVMGGEDFSEYGRTEHKVPISMFSIGAVSAEAMRESVRTGETLPSLHSPIFAPAPEPTIKTGVTAMTAAVLELMGK